MTSAPTRLDVLPLGLKTVIEAVSGEGPASLRLMEMGLLPGAEISVIRQAPFGDPLEVEVTGCRLVMRRAEAGLISVRDPK